MEFLKGFGQALAITHILIWSVVLIIVGVMSFTFWALPNFEGDGWQILRLIEAITVAFAFVASVICYE